MPVLMADGMVMYGHPHVWCSFAPPRRRRNHTALQLRTACNTKHAAAAHEATTATTRHGMIWHRLGWQRTHIAACAA